MHDPNTLAFRIGQWLEIWHVDPCIGGDDDSAGWSTPKLSDQDFKNVDEIVKWNTDAKLWGKSHFEIIYWIWHRCNFQRTGENRALTLSEIDYCMNLAANTTDNLDWVISDVRAEPESHSDRSRHLVMCIYRAMLRHHRKWWQHPKWNVARWRVELHWPKRHVFAIGRKIGETETDW